MRKLRIRGALPLTVLVPAVILVGCFNAESEPALSESTPESGSEHKFAASASTVSTEAAPVDEATEAATNETAEAATNETAEAATNETAEAATNETTEAATNDTAEAPRSATGCHGTTCIFVNGKGLRVNYATVTNKTGKHVGRGMISSTYDGRTWTGPVLRKGESWRFDYSRIMKNGNKVCGSIEGLDVACVTIHS